MYKAIKNITKEMNFLSLSGYVLVACFGLVNFALLARYFAPQDFAKWVIFISSGTLVEMIIKGIMSNALIRFLSGSDHQEKPVLIGSGIVIGLLSSLSITCLLVLCYTLFKDSIDAVGYGAFFAYYPYLIWLNFSWNTAIIIFRAKLRFDHILTIKVLNSVSFFVVLILHYFYFNWTLEQLIWSYLLINLGVSLFCIVKGWSGIQYIFKAQKKSIATLFNFGKHSVFTSLGANLLRNSDTIIISLSPLGTTAVALYSIPLKIVQFMQIPLISFTVTAFPKMSKASIQQNTSKLHTIFHQYTGGLSFLFILIVGLLFTFTEPLIQLISGDQYLNQQLLDVDVVILTKILIAYGLLLPTEKMTGIALDSVNKPQKNALKVGIMLVSNIVGDLIAVFVFQSLILVAVATILFTLIGFILGVHYLKSDIQISWSHLVSGGLSVFKKIGIMMTTLKPVKPSYKDEK
ncbi:MAG: oligosaccharide flippase family protein [Flavobacteriaceae bacterium]|nr:oligosaccharide flippase family protein [Flavobacteriaceae bacterium]